VEVSVIAQKFMFQSTSDDACNALVPPSEVEDGCKKCQKMALVDYYIDNKMTRQERDAAVVFPAFAKVYNSQFFTYIAFNWCN